MLGATALRRLFKSGHWTALQDGEPMPIDNLDPLIGPNSIDVTLGRRILVHKVEPKRWVDPNLEMPEMEEVSLDGTYLATRNGTVTSIAKANPNAHASAHIPGIALGPGTFVLASVRERFVCNRPVGRFFKRHYAPMIDGRSTLARMGIGCHLAAGFGDYGFSGAFTLELHNVGPHTVVLRPRMRIAQVFFVAVDEPVPYDGAYTGQLEKPMGPVTGEGRF